MRFFSLEASRVSISTYRKFVFYKGYTGAVFAQFRVEKNEFFAKKKHKRLQATGKRNLNTKIRVFTTKTLGD